MDVCSRDSGLWTVCDTMEQKVLYGLIIGAIAVVAVAAVAAVVILDDGDDDDGGSISVESKMLVCGNANGDLTIDSSDLSIIEDIISGSKSLDDYPLADANGDGSVDSADVELVQKLINREEGITVYVVTLDRNGNNTTVAVDYPLRNAVTYATNIQMPALYANGGNYIAGYFSASYSVAEKALDGARDLKGSQRQITDAAWTNFTNLDSDLRASGGVGALLVDYSGIKQITSERMSDLNDAGIPMLCYSSADALSEFSTVATLGFLFGGECETESAAYAEKAWSVYSEILDKTEDLSDSERTTYIACTMYIYICGPNSNFNSTASTAGGLPYSKVNSEFASTYTSNSTKMTSTEALSNYKDVGAIINNRSMDWGLDSSGYTSTVIDSWDHDNSGKSSTVYFAGYNDKLVYVNNLLPGAVKMAYMAHALYPEMFSKDWADGILQSYIDMGTDPLSGQSLSTICAYIEYADYLAATGVTYTLTLESAENGGYFTDAAGTVAAAETYTVPADATVKTNLKNSVYTLTISKTVDGGSVTIYGIGSGYAVGSWNLTEVDSDSDLVTGNGTIQAVFKPSHKLTFVAADENGEVSTSTLEGIPEGAKFSVSGAKLTIYGNTVSGTGNDGYALLNWTIDSAAVTSKTSVTGDLTVTANFAKSCTVTIVAGINGTLTVGTKSMSETSLVVPIGITVALTADISTTSTTSTLSVYGTSVKASADDGYVVASWTIGDQTVTAKKTSVTIDGDITVTANFALMG